MYKAFSIQFRMAHNPDTHTPSLIPSFFFLSFTLFLSPVLISPSPQRWIPADWAGQPGWEAEPGVSMYLRGELIYGFWPLRISSQILFLYTCTSSLSLPVLPPLRWNETDWNFAPPKTSRQTAEFCCDARSPVCHSWDPCHLDVCQFLTVSMLSCGCHLCAVGSLLKTLNYIHGTPEQTSAHAPRWPYLNKIQFYPGVEAGKRFEQNRPASSGVTYTKQFLNTLDISFCLRQLLLDVLIDVFSPAFLSVVLYFPKDERLYSVTITAKVTW